MEEVEEEEEEEEKEQKIKEEDEEDRDNDDKDNGGSYSNDDNGGGDALARGRRKDYKKYGPYRRNYRRILGRILQATFGRESLTDLGYEFFQESLTGGFYNHP
ncbi:hypothetical protein PIB30_072348, partial [Stylosanthes scabra]|nr:hypothetical protein [Stylosanthes scabra]